MQKLWRVGDIPASRHADDGVFTPRRILRASPPAAGPHPRLGALWLDALLGCCCFTCLHGCSPGCWVVGMLAGCLLADSWAAAGRLLADWAAADRLLAGCWTAGQLLAGCWPAAGRAAGLPAGLAAGWLLAQDLRQHGQVRGTRSSRALLSCWPGC